jgi:hypothetical protein
LQGCINRAILKVQASQAIQQLCSAEEEAIWDWIFVTDLARGAGLGVALYSRIAVRVVNSNIVPFWSVGRAVKAIRTARLHLGHVPSQY